MLQQQETLYFEYTDLGLHIEFQIIKSTNSFRHVYLLILLHQFLLGMESISGVPFCNNTSFMLNLFLNSCFKTVALVYSNNHVRVLDFIA